MNIMDVIKNIFTAIFYQPLFNALIFLAWLIPGHSIGWAIIVLTILIKLVLLPSNIQMLRQQLRMRALQPKIDELKTKHGDDKAAHSKATMELYAAEKVNPLGSCLSSAVQFPVLISLYQVFIHGLNTVQFNLLYPFTPHMDTINTSFYGLDLTKPEVWVLPTTAALLQFVQTRQMMASTTTAAPTSGKEPDMTQMMQKQMMYVLPLFMLIIGRQVPAALALYYVVFALFAVVQQWAFFRLHKNDPIPDGIVTKEGITVKIRSKSESKS
jgi:YidC/Oxa1 family membrane protein insertase